MQRAGGMVHGPVHQQRVVALAARVRADERPAAQHGGAPHAELPAELLDPESGSEPSNP